MSTTSLHWPSPHITSPPLTSPYVPMAAQILSRTEESPGIFTLQLQLVDPAQRAAFRFAPGQFNMLYLHGVGEVPISIASDPDHPALLGHTIRQVGRVTEALARLEVGQQIGLRGPYGRSWPLTEAEGRDVLVVTGGLGCAPVLGVIEYVLARRERFGRLIILQGVKHTDDLIWRERYAQWASLPNTQVLLAADSANPLWPGHRGRPTDLIELARIDTGRTSAMLCGPEGMMIAAIRLLLQRGIAETRIHLSMERNMQCAVGHCGHCQFGAQFICRQGPVFAYSEIKALLSVKGF